MVGVQFLVVLLGLSKSLNITLLGTQFTISCYIGNIMKFIGSQAGKCDEFYFVLDSL